MNSKFSTVKTNDLIYRFSCASASEQKKNIEFWANRIAIIVVNVPHCKPLNHHLIKVHQNIQQSYRQVQSPQALHRITITSNKMTPARHWMNIHRHTSIAVTRIEFPIQTTTTTIIINTIKFQMLGVTQPQISHHKSHWKKWIHFLRQCRDVKIRPFLPH